MEKLIFPSAEVNCNFNLLFQGKKFLEETKQVQEKNPNIHENVI